MVGSMILKGLLLRLLMSEGTLSIRLFQSLHSMSVKIFVFGQKMSTMLKLITTFSSMQENSTCELWKFLGSHLLIT